jgi:hypothetical protein
MLRGWAGGADPFAKLPYAGMNASCQLFEAVLLPTDQQLAALETIDGSAPRDYGLADLLRRLRIAAGGLPPTRYFDGTTIADLVGFGMPSSTWLIPFEIAGAARDLAPEARARLVGENAERLAHLGDLAGARAALAEMKSLDATDHNDYSNELALALLDPGHAFPAKHDGYIHPGIEEMVRARWGEPVDTNRLLGVYSDECKKRFPAAIAAAQAGDGAELAAVFRECGVSWNVAQKYVLAIAPMIKTHREEVGAAMRLFRNDISTYSVDHIPFRFLDDVAMYRDIARAVGDSESAAAWQKLFDQHVPVLQDRRKLIALLIWTRT